MPHPSRTRRDGWTPQRQAIFLATLRITRSVSRAAAAAGISRKSAYALRARPSGQLFAAGWERALQQPAAEPAGNRRSIDKGHSHPFAALHLHRPKVTAAPPAKVTEAALSRSTLSTVNPGQVGRCDAAAHDAVSPALPLPAAPPRSADPCAPVASS